MPRIVLAGGSGFLGGVLAAHFRRLGYDCVVLTRGERAPTSDARFVRWDAETLGGWTAEIDGCDVVVNLTGRTVNCRYTEKNRRDILESRVNSTRAIGKAIASCGAPPAVWLNSSTATIYKHVYERAMDESGEIASTREAKDEFSVEVAIAWERALDEVPTPHTRKVALRTTLVLGQDENSVVPVFRRLVRLGLGGAMAGGRQYVSWIHEDDFCRAVEWIVSHAELAGGVNVASPNPVTNAELMRTFRELCHVPVGLPATRWMLEIGAAVMGTETELIVKSRRVIPKRLLDSGFQFRFPTLREALADLLSAAA